MPFHQKVRQDLVDSLHPLSKRLIQVFAKGLRHQSSYPVSYVQFFAIYEIFFSSLLTLRKFHFRENISIVGLINNLLSELVSLASNPKMSSKLPFLKSSPLPIASLIRPSISS